MELKRIGMAFLLLASALVAQAQEPMLAPLLKQAVPEAVWKDSTSFRVDLDGDGTKDFVVLGRTSEHVILAALVMPLGMASRPRLIRFTLDPKRPTGLCSENPALEAESLDFDPEKTPIGELPGFQRSPVAQGVKVGGQGCPPFHLYWDRQVGEIRYWRR